MEKTKPKPKVIKATRNVAPLLASSADSSQISATVEGMLMAFVPIIIQVMKQKNIEVAQNDVVGMIQAFTAFLSLAQMTFGSGRKFFKLIMSVVKK